MDGRDVRAPAIRRAVRRLLFVAVLWAAAAAASTAASRGEGLRGEYFEGAGGSARKVREARDPEISTPWIALRWWYLPPESFSVFWSGYLLVEEAGEYTFAVTSDDAARVFIDARLVVENRGAGTGQGHLELTRGSHPVRLQFSQSGGPYAFEWSWARSGEPMRPVPSSALSTARRDPSLAVLLRVLSWVWVAATAAGMILTAQIACRRWGLPRLDARRACRAAAFVVVAGALAAFYVIAATEHGRRINISKARGDQSGYLRDAQQVYANWYGQEPPDLVGQRNRMPVYAAYLALFWNPRMSDDEFFEAAKVLNVWLSLALLLVLAMVFYTWLPPLAATNLLLVVAFGAFIFKAGYSQSELLFYTLFFLTFFLCGRLLVRASMPGDLLLAAAAGVLAALAHLTKAGALPLVGIFLAVYGLRELFRLFRAWSGARRAGLRRFLARAAVAAAMTACLLAVLYPYISNNKRVFGRYFYNVNTTFYVWYDNWAQASVGTILHGDGVGWPTLPPSEIPSFAGYWHSHTARQILDRLAGGVRDMIVRSYHTFWYFKYVTMYLAFAGALIVANPQVAAGVARRRAPLAAFLAVYALVYAAGVAFYEPVSGTGTTRFLLVHLAPLMFALSYLFTRTPLRDAGVRIGPAIATTVHFQLFVLATLAFDLAFTIWPRLMTTYGGF
jgi:hypothetical protein